MTISVTADLTDLNLLECMHAVIQDHAVVMSLIHFSNQLHHIHKGGLFYPKSRARTNTVLLLRHYLPLNAQFPSFLGLTAYILENLVHLLQCFARCLRNTEKGEDRSEQTKHGEEGIRTIASVLYQRRRYQSLQMVSR